MKFTLNQITDIIRLQDDPNADEEILKSHYNDLNKYLNQIFRMVGIEKKDLDQLKDKRGYSFDEEGRYFLIELFSKFKNELVPLRNASYEEVPDEIIVWLYEGIVNIFSKSVNEEKLKEISHKMDIRLDYPVRKMKTIICSDANILTMIQENMLNNSSFYMRGPEQYQWLIGLKQDLDDFCKKWSNIYYRMNEIREEEINEIAFQEVDLMDEQEHKQTYLECTISVLVAEELKKNNEYCKLQEEKYEILGIKDRPFDQRTSIHEQIDVSVNNMVKRKRKIITPKIEHRFSKITQRLDDIYEETSNRIIKEQFPQYKEDLQKSFHSDAVMSVEKLLKTALDEQRQDGQY